MNPGLIVLFMFAVTTIGFVVLAVWYRRNRNAVNGARWAAEVTRMGWQLTSGASQELFARLFVPKGAIEPWRIAFGMVARRRASAQLRTRRRRNEDWIDTYTDTWVCVHLGRYLAVDANEILAFGLPRSSWLMSYPATMFERFDALREDPTVSAIIDRFNTIGWRAAVLDRSVIAVGSGHADGNAILSVARVLGELADAAEVARERAPAQTVDRREAAQWEATAAASGLQLVTSPPRLEGERDGRWFEVMAEPYPQYGKSSTIRVRLRIATGANVAFERRRMLPCTKECRSISCTEVGEWRTRPWNDSGQRIAAHPEFTKALAAVPEAVGAVVVEDDTFTIGMHGMLTDPPALSRAIDVALELCSVVESAAGRGVPFR